MISLRQQNIIAYCDTVTQKANIMVQDSPSRKMDQFIVRLPDGMRDRIKAASEANNRSMNAEIVATLEEKYPAPGHDFEMVLAQTKKDGLPRRAWLIDEWVVVSKEGDILQVVHEGSGSGDGAGDGDGYGRG